MGFHKGTFILSSVTPAHPLVVDLDGTLTPTDTLVESLVKAIKASPLNLLRLPFWLLKGRSGLKEEVAQHGGVDAATLPYRADLLDYLQIEKAKGRRVVLATAAHHSIADGVASHLGVFDQVLASSETNNLKGSAKLAAIQQQVGPDFVYAGDSSADIPIWESAKAAILVGVSDRTAQHVKNTTPIEHVFDNPPVGAKTWLKALRVHQWLKNLLLFVPLLTAFSLLDLNKLFLTAIGVMAFSLAASATYLVNDLWDLDNDRAHPRKRHRPFAAALLPIHHGLVVAAALLVAGCVLAWFVSVGFLAMLLVYLVLTSAYSWVLKEHVLMDVIMLSLLYTLRILAGSVAVNIETSSWLLAFSVFVFLSLALVKRCAELVTLEGQGVASTRGRDYRVGDLVVLWPLGVGAALASVVVFGLFISAPETQARYATPQLLWFVAIGLIYWLSRIWVQTSRGDMHDDPVVFAIKDPNSRVTVVVMVLLMLLAYAVPFKPYFQP
jgi:4-hydroxybenzoate polyprenyltransferase/phosphoserine phosphatase